MKKSDKKQDGSMITQNNDAVDGVLSVSYTHLRAHET